MKFWGTSNTHGVHTIYGVGHWHRHQTDGRECRWNTLEGNCCEKGLVIHSVLLCGWESRELIMSCWVVNMCLELNEQTVVGFWIPIEIEVLLLTMSSDPLHPRWMVWITKRGTGGYQPLTHSRSDRMWTWDTGDSSLSGIYNLDGIEFNVEFALEYDTLLLAYFMATQSKSQPSFMEVLSISKLHMRDMTMTLQVNLSKTSITSTV